MPSAARGTPGLTRVHRAQSSLRALLAQTLDRDDDYDNEDHKHDGQSRRKAYRSLGERKDVDLESWNRRRAAGSSGCCDVDNVKCGKRIDHCDGKAHTDFISEKRNGNSHELLE